MDLIFLVASQGDQFDEVICFWLPNHSIRFCLHPDRIAGTTTRYSFVDDRSDLGDYAWYFDNSGYKTNPVGQKQSNPWDLYDIHGNVWEWVQDRWNNDYDGAPTDGSAWEEGSSSCHVWRGGSWNFLAGYHRSASRRIFNFLDLRTEYIGFRLLQEV
jgi:formylglycine-generating enzyme required for sulfatase activity